MLEITEANFNIESNRLVGVKTKSSTMLQDERIVQKLFKIFTFVILINPSLVFQQHAKVEEREVENSKLFLLFA